MPGPTLFRMKGSCSMVPHILLRELKIPFNDMPMQADKNNAYSPIDTSISRADFLRYNPSGFVPTLVLEDGTSITEMPAVLTYISSLVPDRHMMGHAGLEAAKVYEWIAFVQGALLEYGFAAVFRPERALPPDATKEMRDVVTGKGHKKILSCFELIEGRLDGSGYAVGGRLTAVDMLVLPSWQWATMMELDLTKYPKLRGVVAKALELDSVQTVLKIEGIERYFQL